MEREVLNTVNVMENNEERRDEPERMNIEDVDATPEHISRFGNFRKGSLNRDYGLCSVFMLKTKFQLYNLKGKKQILPLRFVYFEETNPRGSMKLITISHTHQN